MDYKKLIDKSIPIYGKMLSIPLASYIGCSSPTKPDEETEGLYRSGEQVCYSDGTKSGYITLLEDTVPGSIVVKAQRENGTKFYAMVSNILSNSECRR